MAWLYALPISQAMRNFPALSTAVHLLHIGSVMFVLASISKVDLRLIGVADTQTPVTELLAGVLPWTWKAFAVAATTGLLMFLSDAPGLFSNPAFRLKIVLIGLAGLNMALFHKVIYRGVARWDADRPTAMAAKAAGALSLALWMGVFLCATRI